MCNICHCSSLQPIRSQSHPFHSQSTLESKKTATKVELTQTKPRKLLPTVAVVLQTTQLKSIKNQLPYSSQILFRPRLIGPSIRQPSQKMAHQNVQKKSKGQHKLKAKVQIICYLKQKSKKTLKLENIFHEKSFVVIQYFQGYFL